MSITLLNSPAAFSFARNPLWYKLQTSDHLLTTGNVAEFYITIGEWPALDETILIEWEHPDGAISQTFTFKAAPDQSGLQLLRSTIYTLSMYCDLLAEQFKLNYYIFRDWNVTRSSTDRIYFTARANGLLDPTITESSSNVSATVNETGEDVAQKENFRILVETYQSDGTVLLGTDLLSVDNDGIGWIDITEYCRQVLTHGFTWPQDSSSLINELSLEEAFYIRTGNYYGNPATPQIMTKQTQFKAIYGGIGKQRQALFNELSETLYNYIAQFGAFLTLQPKTVDIDAITPHSLFWLNTTTNTTLKLYFRAYYTNGNTVDYLAETKTGCSKDKIYEILTGPAQLFANITWTTYEGHHVYKYDVFIANSSGVAISETRTFMIDYAGHMHVRYFKYLNSLGGYDTLRCTGMFTKSRKYSADSISGTLDPDFTTADHESRSFNASTVEVFKGSTGFFERLSDYGKWMAESFSEFMLSEKVYEITDEGLVPVKILKNEQLILNDNESLFAMAFEYEKTYIDELSVNIVDSGKAQNPTYFGEGFSGAFIQPPGTIITTPIGT